MASRAFTSFEIIDPRSTIVPAQIIDSILILHSLGTVILNVLLITLLLSTAIIKAILSVQMLANSMFLQRTAYFANSHPKYLAYHIPNSNYSIVKIAITITVTPNYKYPSYPIKLFQPTIFHHLKMKMNFIFINSRLTITLCHAISHFIIPPNLSFYSAVKPTDSFTFELV